MDRALLKEVLALHPRESEALVLPKRREPPTSPDHAAQHEYEYVSEREIEIVDSAGCAPVVERESASLSPLAIELEDKIVVDVPPLPAQLTVRPGLWRMFAIGVVSTLLSATATFYVTGRDAPVAMTRAGAAAVEAPAPVLAPPPATVLAPPPPATVLAFTEADAVDVSVDALPDAVQVTAARRPAAAHPATTTATPAPTAHPTSTPAPTATPTEPNADPESAPPPAPSPTEAPTPDGE